MNDNLSFLQKVIINIDEYKNKKALFLEDFEKYLLDNEYFCKKEKKIMFQSSMKKLDKKISSQFNRKNLLFIKLFKKEQDIVY